MQKIPHVLLTKMFKFIEGIINQKGLNFIEGIINQKSRISDAVKSGIDMPLNIGYKIKSIPVSKLFGFWYLFYDEDSTKAVRFDTNANEFRQPFVNFLKKIQFNVIRELHLSTNLNVKCDLEPLLYNLRTKLRIFSYHPSSDISEMTENQVMEAISIAECQLEEFRFNEDLMGQGLKKKTILKFLQHQKDCLHILNLKNWLHQITETSEIVEIFREISEMVGLREVKINLVWLIRNAIISGTPNVQLPLVEYFKNLETLTIFGYSALPIAELQPPPQVPANDLGDLNMIQGANFTSGNMMPIRAWVALSQAIPSTKINLDKNFPIKFEVDGLYFDQSYGAALNNFENISFRYHVTASDSGWILDANWKQLKCLKIQDGASGSFSARFYNTDEFTLPRWNRTFPQLTFVELKLSQLSFPYTSFVSLLFGSPNLANLIIRAQTPKAFTNSVIANFDVQDFETRCNNHRFKLTQLVLVNQGIELSQEGEERENVSEIGRMRLVVAQEWAHIRHAIPELVEDHVMETEANVDDHNYAANRSIEMEMARRELRLPRELGNVGERQNDHDYERINSRSLERLLESNGSARERRRPEPRLQLPNNSRGGQAIANPAPRIVDPDIPRLFRRRWYRPLLPFQSVLDIFNACLHLEQVEIVTTSAETDILRQNLGEFFDIQNPDPPLDVNDL